MRSAQCAPGYPIGGGRHAHRRRAHVVHHQPRPGGFQIRGARKRAVPAPAGAPGGDDRGRPAGGSVAARRGWLREARACRSATRAIHLGAPERVRVFLQAGGPGRRLGERREPAGDQLQQPAARALPLRGARRDSRRAGRRAVLSLRGAAAFLRDGVVPSAGARPCCWRRFGRSISCACGRSATASRWCWRNARGWRARSTTRWRRASWGFPRNSTRWPCACRTRTTPARKYLDMARRMARHSLTEARRSVMDLRASMLEGQDLAAALESGARMWTAGPAWRSRWTVNGSAGPAAAGDGAASAAHRARRR